ncbi:hypothetical protein D7V93_21930 [Corallococcus llansteffanensis]|uniref:Uncharacterized protein n=1 Tax=Corallococcus llansteffanensis TaxID=2316731 RepID=A0A3A8PKJ7_9BACT|nr:hypothetical protein D7V93_21930 [Corallococcus llansteffanensis]
MPWWDSCLTMPQPRDIRLPESPHVQVQDASARRPLRHRLPVRVRERTREEGRRVGFRGPAGQGGLGGLGGQGRRQGQGGAGAEGRQGQGQGQQRRQGQVRGRGVAPTPEMLRQCSPARCSPASTRNARRLPRGGSGQVAKREKAHGGL